MIKVLPTNNKLIPLLKVLDPLSKKFDNFLFINEILKNLLTVFEKPLLIEDVDDLQSYDYQIRVLR